MSLLATTHSKRVFLFINSLECLIQPFSNQGTMIVSPLSSLSSQFPLFFSRSSLLCSLLLPLFKSPLTASFPLLLFLLPHGFLLQLHVQINLIGSTQHPRSGEYIPLKLRHRLPSRNLLSRIFYNTTPLQFQLLNAPETPNSAFDLDYTSNIHCLAINLDLAVIANCNIDVEV
jgi:hypothetical protein